MTDFQAHIIALVICSEFTIFRSKVFWTERMEWKVDWFTKLDLPIFALLALLLLFKKLQTCSIAFLRLLPAASSVNEDVPAAESYRALLPGQTEQYFLESYFTFFTQFLKSSSNQLYWHYFKSLIIINQLSSISTNRIWKLKWQNSSPVARCFPN